MGPIEFSFNNFHEARNRTPENMPFAALPITSKENFFSANRQSFSDHVPIAASVTESDEGLASTFRVTSWNVMHTSRLAEQRVAQSLNNSPIFVYNVKDSEQPNLTKRELCNVKSVMRLLRTTHILCLQEANREILRELQSQVDKKRYQIVATYINHAHICITIFNQTIFEFICALSLHGFCDRTENLVQELHVRNKRTYSIYQIFNAQLLSRPIEAREELVEWVSRQIDAQAKVILMAGSLSQPVMSVAKALKGIKHARFLPVPIPYDSTINSDDKPATFDHIFVSLPPKEPHHQAIPCSLEETLGCSLASSFLGVSQQNPIDQAFPDYRVPNDVALLIFRQMSPETLGKAARVCLNWRKLAYHPSLWDVRHLFPSARFIGSEIWDRHFDLQKCSLTLWETGRLCLDGPLYMKLKQLCAEIEDDAGLTFITFPEKFCYHHLIQLAGAPKKGTPIQFEHEWWSQRLPEKWGHIAIETLTTAVMTNGPFKTSRKYNAWAQDTLVEKLGCEMQEFLKTATLASLTFLMTEDKVPVRLFNTNRYTYIRSFRNVLVGVFDAKKNSLAVQYYDDDCDYGEAVAVGGQLRFPGIGI